ncbi:MAG: hypothetical protein SPF69_04135 [Candidatus Ornithospirochaeta sp.]|nr:hypothetical protein [Sphaerochaetaceae bacterium]MDY5523259.1 hypothetical protein [Candidatus Ornithospirochaeta sp.]
MDFSTTNIPDTIVPISKPLPSDNHISIDNRLLSLCEMISSGAEGAIYRIKEDTNNVVKIYHVDGDFNQLLTVRKQKKLKLLTSLDLSKVHPCICAPKKLCYDSRKLEIIGFSMEFIEKTVSLGDILLSISTRTNTAYNRKELVSICLQIAQILSSLSNVENHQVLVGDLKPENFLITEDYKVYIVDVDSFQIDEFPCPVGTPDLTPPEWEGMQFNNFLRDIYGERFSAAALFFKILFLDINYFNHRELPENEEKEQKYIFSYNIDGTVQDSVPIGPSMYIWGNLPVYIRRLFVRAFTSFDNNRRNRPSLKEWVSAFSRYMDDFSFLSKHGSSFGQLLPTSYPYWFEKGKIHECLFCKSQIPFTINKGLPICTKDMVLGKKLYNQKCHRCGEIFYSTLKNDNICENCKENIDVNCIYCGDTYVEKKSLLKEGKPQVCPQCADKANHFLKKFIARFRAITLMDYKFDSDLVSPRTLDILLKDYMPSFAQYNILPEVQTCFRDAIQYIKDYSVVIEIKSKFSLLNNNRLKAIDSSHISNSDLCYFIKNNFPRGLLNDINPDSLSQLQQSLSELSETAWTLWANQLKSLKNAIDEQYENRQTILQIYTFFCNFPSSLLEKDLSCFYECKKKLEEIGSLQGVDISHYIKILDLCLDLRKSYKSVEKVIDSLQISFHSPISSIRPKIQKLEEGISNFLGKWGDYLEEHLNDIYMDILSNYSEVLEHHYLRLESQIDRNLSISQIYDIIESLSEIIDYPDTPELIQSYVFKIKSIQYQEAINCERKAKNSTDYLAAKQKFAQLLSYSDAKKHVEICNQLFLQKCKEEKEKNRLVSALSILLKDINNKRIEERICELPSLFRQIEMACSSRSCSLLLRNTENCIGIPEYEVFFTACRKKQQELKEKEDILRKKIDNLPVLQTKLRKADSVDECTLILKLAEECRDMPEYKDFFTDCENKLQELKQKEVIIKIGILPSMQMKLKKANSADECAEILRITEDCRDIPEYRVFFTACRNKQQELKKKEEQIKIKINNLPSLRMKLQKAESVDECSEILKIAEECLDIPEYKSLFSECEIKINDIYFQYQNNFIEALLLASSIQRCIEIKDEACLQLCDYYSENKQIIDEAFLNAVKRILNNTILSVKAAKTIPEINKITKSISEYAFIEGVSECLEDCLRYKKTLSREIEQKTILEIESSKKTTEIDSISEKLNEFFGDETPNSLKNTLETKRKKLKRKERIISTLYKFFSKTSG